MKQKTFKPALLALFVALSAVACDKEPADEPGALPPQQQLPNPLPAAALVKQLKRSETDHQTFTYNDKGQVSQLKSQWQYVEGDPTKIRTIVYDFQYDAQNKPIQVNTEGGFSDRYFYHGDLIHTTKELYPGGGVAKEVTYLYADNWISHEIWRVSNLPGEPVTVYKHLFAYDAKGNLTKITIYEQDDDLEFKLLSTTEYSDFDDKINPTSWMLRYPHLPQMRWQFNNPRREVRRLATGEEEITMYAYEYNASGLPVIKRTTLPDGKMTTVNYQY
ncbi:MAG: hypothetical protein DYG98_25960 [Haliscomenobacteraceae bacterium CHB4]|nr:hypothetical protein [Saprospiraceae bacterium]MCE7926507.1 hypothetical protein [Haliscomenobacteraceae bacterium CHB4]